VGSANAAMVDGRLRVTNSARGTPEKKGPITPEPGVARQNVSSKKAGGRSTERVRTEMPRKQAAAADKAPAAQVEASPDAQAPKEHTINVGSHKIQMVIHPEEKARLNKFGSYRGIQRT
jgi:hypothetical protein